MSSRRPKRDHLARLAVASAVTATAALALACGGDERAEAPPVDSSTDLSPHAERLEVLERRLTSLGGRYGCLVTPRPETGPAIVFVVGGAAARSEAARIIRELSLARLTTVRQ